MCIRVSRRRLRRRGPRLGLAGGGGGGKRRERVRWTGDGGDGERVGGLGGGNGGVLQ